MSTAPRIQSADRVTLMLSLVPYILGNDGVTITELATVFKTAPQEIRELVNRLRGMGVPGESGAYLPNDLFQIDDDLFELDDMVSLTHTVGLEHAPRLSGHEAAVLIAGLQYVSSMLPASESETVLELQKKLALGTANTMPNIAIEQRERNEVLELLSQAHATGRQFSFDYPDSSGTWLTRNVDVIRLDMVGGLSYLRAWCHLRDALRTFRCDRMRNAAVSEKETTTHIDAQNIPLDLFDQTDENLMSAKLGIEESMLERLSDFSPTEVHPLQSEKLEVRISFRDVAKIINLVASHPGRIQLREPESARSQLLERAKRARAAYATNTTDAH